MKYLLDTNILIDFFRNDKKTVKLIAKTAKDGFALNVITVAEYLVGAHKSTSPLKNIQNFEDFLKSNDIPIIDINSNIAYEYAHQLSVLEQQGQKIAGFDMLIAASAITHKLILISNDKAFGRIKDLKILK